jgi:hypothetical protein
MLEFFEFWYGQNNKYEFLVFHKDRKPPKIRKETEKVFAILHADKNHWVAVELSYKQHRIRYGDSKSQGVNQHLIDELIRWLVDDKQHQQWDAGMKKVTRLPIPKQEDSTSCGLFALMAVEWAVNKHVDKSFVDPLALRIRFLGHVAGITKVCFALLLL